MIVKVRGTIVHHGNGFVVSECNGIGYKIILPEEVAHGLRDEVDLFTHEVTREDVRELFGFTSIEALELFWKLINISGVGPRGAQKIVYAGPIFEVKQHLMDGDLAFLTAISGIGKKTGQKIILEMKGVLADEPGVPSGDPEAEDALVGLGYSKKEAADALGRVKEETTEKRIRAALKLLSKK